MSDFTEARNDWPALPLDAWSDTCDTLHLWTQMVGKVKLALCPFQNHYWHVALHLTARGLTTGTIPIEPGSLSIDLDFLADRLRIATTSGATAEITLEPRSVASFYARFQESLRAVGVDVALNPLPSEMPNPIPFDRDETHASYDAEAVRRWWRILVHTERALRRQAATFVGKASPVLFYWGSFDLAQALYSGNPAPWIEGVPRFVSIAEDRENAARGFWPGNTSMSGVTYGEPAFYAYAYPEPNGFKDSGIPGASYVPELGQFILPYARVRTAADPDQLLFDFFRATYEAATIGGGWDRETLESRHPEATSE